MNHDSWNLKRENPYFERHTYNVQGANDAIGAGRRMAFQAAGEEGQLGVRSII